MNCKRAKENISLFIDGQLEPAGQARLNEHLEICPDCSSYLDDLKAGLAVLHGEGMEDPPENFEWNLRRKIQLAMTQRESFPLEDRSDRRDLWRFGLSAAAALLIMLSGGTLWYQSQFSGQSPGLTGTGLQVSGEEDTGRVGRPGWVDPLPGGAMPVTDRIGGAGGIPASEMGRDYGRPQHSGPADSLTAQDLN